MRLFVAILILLFSPFGNALEVDDSPSTPGTWGFRPLEGAVTALNPPGFTWRPVGKAQSYLMEIANDSEFSEVVYQSGPTPWNAHCPPSTLKTGVPLYWRYAVVDESGARSEWSKARSFAVSPEAVEFPKPTLEDLKNRISKEHPRLFFRDSDIPSLRSLGEGALEDRWKALIASADKLIENPIDTSEPPLYPKGTERLGEEWKKIWWGNRVRTIAVADGAATLAFAYRLSGEEKYGQAARDLLMAFCQWDPKGSTQYDYNDEAAMPALYFPSRAYTWAYPMLSEEDRAKVVEVMTIRGRDCFDHLRFRKHLWNPYASHSNRAWHFLGELAVAFIEEIPEAETWLDYATTLFYTCYPVWGDEDGGWHEGVAYWKSYLTRFGYWILTMDSAFGIDVFERPFFRTTGYYGMYMVPPGTRHAGFGDQSPSANLDRGSGPFMAMFASGARNPHWKWYADQVDEEVPYNYVGYLWTAKAVGLEAEPPADLPGSRRFRGVGVAILNSNLLAGKENVQLFFKSSPMGSQSHGFNANNTFHLNVFGQPALVNTGRRDVHGSPHHKEWMWETKSQNAILVNGEGQEKHSPEATGRITHFETTADLDLVVGEAGDSYPQLNRWTRAIVFVKPDVFIIHDVLEAPAPSTYRFLLHAPSEFDLADGDGSPDARWSNDEVGVDIEFLHPRELSVSQTNGYDPPPHEWANFKIDEWHLAAEPEGENARQTFLTVLSVNGSKREVGYEVLDADKDSFSLRIEGGPALVLDPEKLSISSQTFEKEVTYAP